MKRLVAVAALSAGLAGVANAAEFQPIGTLGMGGAGVARSMGAYASYWNPAGLAFAPKAFSSSVGVGVGLRVSDGLANNVDRLAKFTEEDSNGNTVFDNLESLSSSVSTASSAKAVGDIVNMLTVFNDIKTEKGTLSLNVDAVAGFQIKQLGFGIYGLGEGFAQPLPDLVNVLPKLDDTETPVNIGTLATATAGSASGYSVTNLTAAQVTEIKTALGSLPTTITASQMNDIIAAIDKGITSSSSLNSNLPQLTPDQAVDTIKSTLVPALTAAANGSTIDNNQTAVMVKSALFVEIPLAYGHPFSLGKYGRIGVGGAIKAVRGRVYQSRIRLIDANGDGVESEDITDSLKENYTESTNVTFDLGTQYKYSHWLTVGLVAKNLTSPTFKSPALKDQNGNYVDLNGNIISSASARVTDADVKLKPQVRFGVALAPLSWLTIASDLDLTENDTVLSSLDYKSRNLGAGVELHLSWLKLRAGMYKNLANAETGSVATGGLTIGIPWVLLEVDGAYGLDQAKYKEKDYPKEAKLQAQIVVQF